MAAKIFGDAALVRGGDAVNETAGAVDAQDLAFGELECEPGGLVAFVSEAKARAAFGGCQLGEDAVSQQARAEIMRTRDGFVFAIRRFGVSDGRRCFGAGRRHDEEVAVVGHPRARLMRAAETLDSCGAVFKGPAALAGLRSPSDHAMRRDHERQRVSGGEAVVRIGALEGIDLIGQRRRDRGTPRARARGAFRGNRAQDAFERG